jgi:general secretion pathway protein L
MLTEIGPNEFVLSAEATPKTPAPAECRFAMDEAGVNAPVLPDDWRSVLRGSRLDVRLRPARFLFRPLDLPRQAGAFLDAMVRSQIDRLTPWTAGEAVFSWSPPTETANDRIGLTVVAAPRAKISPLLGFAEDSEVGSVAIRTSPDASPDTVGQDYTLLEKRMGGSFDIERVRRVLTVTLLVAAVAAAVSLVGADIYGGGLDSQRKQLSRKISERRAAMRLNVASTDDSSQNILVRRKHTTPSSVMVLEALSGILPDNTYVTELRIEKDKLQIVGITQDAPSLVKLIEQSPHFTRATFFAPTTRAANDPGERFHVEARITPHFGRGT